MFIANTANFRGEDDIPPQVRLFSKYPAIIRVKLSVKFLLLCIRIFLYQILTSFFVFSSYLIFVSSSALTDSEGTNTSLAAPGALANRLQRRTALKANEANLDPPNQKYEITSL